MKTPEPAPQDAALEWLVRLRDTEAGAAERRAFEAWLQADPRHAAAYREAETLWAALDQVAPAATARKARVVPLPAGRRRAVPRLRRLAQAAAFAGLAVLAGYSVTGPQPLNRLLADYSTAAGAQRTVALADGSAVALNGTSALSLDFTPGERRVVLRGGEAFFEVAKDPRRPFVVETALGQVTVLGTAFVVNTGDGFVDVTVTESRVAVSHAAGGSVTLQAGETVRLQRDRLGAKSTRDAAQALAWRSGKLVFRDTPLGEVVDALERQRPGRIALMDDALHEIRVTGSFNLEAAGESETGGRAAGDNMLDALAAAFPLRVVRVSDYLVLLFPQDRG